MIEFTLKVRRVITAERVVKVTARNLFEAKDMAAIKAIKCPWLADESPAPGVTVKPALTYVDNAGAS